MKSVSIFTLQSAGLTVGALAPCKGGFYRVTVTQKYIRKTTGMYPIRAVHWYNFVQFGGDECLFRFRYEFL